MVVGRGAAPPEQELLGDHRFSEGTAARAASVGSLDARVVDVRVLVLAERAQGTQHPARTHRSRFAIDDTVECVSVEGTAHELPAERQQEVAETYAAKYEPDPVKQAEMVTFVTSHSMWEVVPQRAFAIIEREDEFARRATRWVW